MGGGPGGEGVSSGAVGDAGLLAFIKAQEGGPLLTGSSVFLVPSRWWRSELVPFAEAKAGVLGVVDPETRAEPGPIGEEGPPLVLLLGLLSVVSM